MIEDGHYWFGVRLKSFGVQDPQTARIVSDMSWQMTVATDSRTTGRSTAGEFIGSFSSKRSVSRGTALPRIVDRPVWQGGNEGRSGATFWS